MSGDFDKSDSDKSDELTEFNIGNIVEKSNNSFQHLHHDFLERLFSRINVAAAEGKYTFFLSPHGRNKNALYSLYSPRELERLRPRPPSQSDLFTYLKQAGFQVKTHQHFRLSISWGHNADPLENPKTWIMRRKGGD